MCLQDAERPGSTMEPEVLESSPMLVSSLDPNEFRAVLVAAGDSISVALSSEGKIKAWGSFRVNI